LKSNLHKYNSFNRLQLLYLFYKLIV